MGGDWVSEHDGKMDRKTKTEIQKRGSETSTRKLEATFLRLFLGSADASSLDQWSEVGERGAQAHERMLQNSQLFLIDWEERMRYLQQVMSRRTLLGVDLQSQMEEVTEDVRQVVFIFDGWGTIRGDQVEGTQRRFC